MRPHPAPATEKPAFATRRAITALARRVGERLAREGVLGRFSLDFVVVRD
jgi:hypothetical protein